MESSFETYSHKIVKLYDDIVWYTARKPSGIFPRHYKVLNHDDTIMTSKITSCYDSRHMKQHICHYFWITLSDLYNPDITSYKTLVFLHANVATCTFRNMKSLIIGRVYWKFLFTKMLADKFLEMSRNF